MRKLITLLAVLFGWPALASAQIVEYYHLDSVGNVLAVTDSTGVVVEQHDYLPFGEEWCGTGPCGSVTGGQPKRFTGKERDAETGLDYFGARYYEANIGRFTTTDPFLEQGAALVDPQLWNRYAYGRNNPLRYVDPDGRDVQELLEVSQRAVDAVAKPLIMSAYPAAKVGAGAFAAPAAVGLGVGGALYLNVYAYQSEAAANLRLQEVMAASGNDLATKAAREKQAAREGVSASGQATDKFGNKLGPSGKPMVHETQSNTREGARNKALNEGAGAVEHSNPKKGEPHFHATDGKGEKKPSSAHHNYPGN